MPAQIDYVIAAGVFLGAFLFLTAFVSNYSNTSFSAILTTNLRESALAMLDGIGRDAGGNKITDFGLGTDAFTFQVRITNPGSSTGNDSTSFKLSDVGYPDADENSVSVQDGDTVIPHALAGGNFRFNTDVPPSDKTVSVWFDDDSNFPTKSSTVPNIADAFNSTLLQVERIRVVSYARLQALNATPYSSVREDFNFRISLVDRNGIDYYSYGEIPPEGNVIALQRPAVFQTQGAVYVKGYLIAQVW